MIVKTPILTNIYRFNYLKNILLIISIIIGFSSSSKADTLVVNFNGSKFYHISSDSNDKVLIFLHGGISNPKFKDTSVMPDLNFILEGNTIFITNALLNGFDLLIPITNDSLNWLTNHTYSFRQFESYLKTFNNYSKKYISGFSDGGTGAYKIFHTNHQYFEGLLVFNGYPQHHDFYSKVNYKDITDKKVLFFSTFNDKVIPYEFLMTEYCKQKKYNTNTYLYIKKGGHTFVDYDLESANTCFNILTSKVKASKNDSIHGLLLDDKLIEFYVFRKMIVKKFNYGHDYYEENRKQEKIYNKKQHRVSMKHQ